MGFLDDVNKRAGQVLDGAGGLLKSPLGQVVKNYFGYVPVVGPALSMAESGLDGRQELKDIREQYGEQIAEWQQKRTGKQTLPEQITLATTAKFVDENVILGEKIRDGVTEAARKSVSAGSGRISPLVEAGLQKLVPERDTPSPLDKVNEIKWALESGEKVHPGTVLDIAKGVMELNYQSFDRLEPEMQQAYQQRAEVVAASLNEGKITPESLVVVMGQTTRNKEGELETTFQKAARLTEELKGEDISPEVREAKLIGVAKISLSGGALKVGVIEPEVSIVR